MLFKCWSGSCLISSLVAFLYFADSCSKPTWCVSMNTSKCGIKYISKTLLFLTAWLAQIDTDISRYLNVSKMKTNREKIGPFNFWVL